MYSRRHGVHKGRSARAFRAGTSQTKALNHGLKPMRGGWRI